MIIRNYINEEAKKNPYFLSLAELNGSSILIKDFFTPYVRLNNIYLPENFNPATKERPLQYSFYVLEENSKITLIEGRGSIGSCAALILSGRRNLEKTLGIQLNKNLKLD